MVTIIIPAYNEEDAIRGLLDELTGLIEQHGWEVIVVNDASEDNTSEIVARYKNIRLLNQPYHKGYGASLKTGVRVASNDYIVTMDADGQHSPGEVLKLIAHMREFDMVVGSRENQENAAWQRKPGKLLLSWTANYLSGMKIPDINSGFRLIRRKCIEEFMHILPNGFSFSTTITLAMLKAAYNIKYVPVTVERREAGKSSVKQARDGLITLLLIARCISLFNPLKVYAPVGAILFAIGVLFSVYGIVFFQSFPKTAIVLILSGIIILFFGILADQIAAIRRINQ